MKSQRHLKFIASLPCLVTGCIGATQVHHLMRGVLRGMGMKAGDEWALPLHFKVHDALHRDGNERRFFDQRLIFTPEIHAKELVKYSLKNDHDGAQEYILNQVRNRGICKDYE